MTLATTPTTTGRRTRPGPGPERGHPRSSSRGAGDAAPNTTCAGRAGIKRAGGPAAPGRPASKMGKGG